MCIHQPYWQKRQRLQSQLSKVEIDWLFDEGSLTKRFILLSKDNFSLEVLSEKKQFLRMDEYICLTIPPSQKKWVREVMLKGYNEPWVYARSIIIPNNETSNELMNIGQQPLGSILFNSNYFKRSAIEVTTYPIELLPTQYRFFKLWARRSCFTSNEQIILVQEIFLPQFWSQTS